MLMQQLMTQLQVRFPGAIIAWRHRKRAGFYAAWVRAGLRVYLEDGIAHLDMLRQCLPRSRVNDP